MWKVLIIVAAIFVIPIISVVGKGIMDLVTENYTYASYGGTNITGAVTWLVPYVRSYWWLAPVALAVGIILLVMRREEQEAPQFPMFRQQKAPRMPKPPKQQVKQQPKKKQPPPIFLGR
jgi:hypothetical protein